MATDLVTVEPETTLYDAMLLINRKKIKHLPVVKGNVVLGIITQLFFGFGCGDLQYSTIFCFVSTSKTFHAGSKQWLILKQRLE